MVQIPVAPKVLRNVSDKDDDDESLAVVETDVVQPSSSSQNVPQLFLQEDSMI